MERLIEQERSVVVAADVPTIENLKSLVKATCGIEGIGGYKVGLELALTYGLKRVVEAAWCSEKPVIYDHQKAGNDIPEMGVRFAQVCRAADVDAVILFPFAGTVTETDWIRACQDQELRVLVGGHMTQPQFLAKEGGFVADFAPEKILEIAARNGVKDFVVPGNKPQFVEYYRKVLERWLGPDNFVLYAPGFITQGGDISETGKVAGRYWHAIVGSAIYKAGDPKAAAERITQQIR